MNTVCAFVCVGMLVIMKCTSSCKSSTFPGVLKNLEKVMRSPDDRAFLTRQAKSMVSGDITEM